MMLSNRSKGVSPPGSSLEGMTKVDCFGLLIIFSASPASDESRLEVLRISRLPSQFLIGQTSASHGGQDFRETSAVPIIMFALVVSECLLIQITEQVERLDADVGSFQAALQERPEILDSVRVNVAVYVLFRVIHELVNIIRIEASIGREFVSENFRARFDIRAHFLLQRMALAVSDVLHADLASLAIQQAHDQLFARSARAGDFRFLVLVHEAGEPTDKRFVRFDGTAPAEFREGSALHCKADAMEHEPCGFLTDFQITSEFARTDSVLTVPDQPDSGQPLSQRQRRILEDGSYLDAELTAGMLLVALPTALIGEIVDLIASAGGALHHTVRPTARDHICDAAIFIGVVADRFDQSFRRVFVRVHVFNLTHGCGLVKSILAQIKPVPTRGNGLL
jgi:hypothetical protein